MLVLASLSSGLVGCGGGGGTAPAPPLVLNSPSSSGLDQGRAAALMQDLEGEGAGWIGLIESDSARIQLDGEDPGTNAALAKLPPAVISSMERIPTRYSRFQYFQSTIAGGQDPGQYLLWGRRPETLLVGRAKYQLQSNWTCIGCRADGAILSGTATGELMLDFDELNGDVSLNGNGLALAATLGIEKSYMFRQNNPATLSFEGEAIPLDRTSITGSVFGGNGDEAGFLYGLGGVTATVTGAAIGTR